MGCPQSEGTVSSAVWVGPRSIQAVSPPKKAGGWRGDGVGGKGNSGGFLILLPLPHLGNGSRASDTRGCGP